MNQLQTGRQVSIGQMTDRLLGTERKKRTQLPEPGLQSFQQILKETGEEAERLRFSKHAMERLSSRNIKLSAQQQERLSDGVDKASKKGIKDSLVLVDNLAFIVNVTNKTVITAVGEGEDRIFTNIDGAVIS